MLFLSFGIQHSRDHPHLASACNFYVLNGFECAARVLSHVRDGLISNERLPYGVVSVLQSNRCSCLMPFAAGCDFHLPELFGVLSFEGQHCNGL